MAEDRCREDFKDIEDLKACVALFGPCIVKNLKQGETKLWCTCGLSKSQPWCDNSHKETPFKPLVWRVTGTLKDGRAQTMYSLCGCKYSSSRPYCD
ncbi:hypothetical protein BZG36_03575 [Bifiguratus adelaidae]|uniref:Iron-binding zinc finger CDGSH type domain-containing protein n=1 Tax=Bifiguratus adelaidae TaxID=1938954 RepID=A0A261Y0B9_9FUNG|nr:hypothetical protein BZG36_03575 [Bifiguratus adelaidae]